MSNLKSQIGLIASLITILFFLINYVYTAHRNQELQTELTRAQSDAQTRYALLEQSLNDKFDRLHIDIQAEVRRQVQDGAPPQGEENSRAAPLASRPASGSSSQDHLPTTDVLSQIRLPDDVQTVWVMFQTKGPIEQSKCRTYAVVSSAEFQDRIEEFRNQALKNNEKLIVTALTRQGQWVNQISYGTKQLSPAAHYTCNGKIDYGFEIPLDR
jgi:hypothetical protein